jgi:hypothetical protein
LPISTARISHQGGCIDPRIWKSLFGKETWQIGMRGSDASTLVRYAGWTRLSRRDCHQQLVNRSRGFHGYESAGFGRARGGATWSTDAKRPGYHRTPGVEDGVGVAWKVGVKPHAPAPPTRR